MKAKMQPPSHAQLLLGGLLGTGVVRRFFEAGWRVRGC